MVEQMLESGRLHRLPDHAPERALRVLENAAHVDAIIAVSAGLMPIGLQSSSEMQIANDALRPLAGVVRSARLAAVSAILHSAWRSSLNRFSRASRTQRGGVHGCPVHAEAVARHRSGPIDPWPASRPYAELVDQVRRPAGRSAGRRWAWSPGRTRSRRPRPVLRSSLSRSHTTSMWSATKPIGQTIDRLGAAVGQRREVFGHIGFQPRHLRRAGPRLPHLVVVGVAGGRRDQRGGVGDLAAVELRAAARRRPRSGTECAVNTSRASARSCAGRVAAASAIAVGEHLDRAADGRSTGAA